MAGGSLLIGAPSSGSGKTTVTLALMALLTAQNKQVQGFKVGPDYIDPAFHHLITGRPSYNLDVWMGGEMDVRQTYLRHSRDADLTLIEGVMGLLDGASSDSNRGSSAHVAEILNCPTLLVLDIRAMARSAAAIVKGFQMLAGQAEIRAVLMNRAGSARHAEMVQSAIEAETGVPCVGYLPHNTEIVLPERHLGLVTAHESQDQSWAKMEQAGRLLQDHVDVNQLLDIAKTARGPAEAVREIKRGVPTSRPKVAIAYDRAFNFYYPANLDLLTQMGAELLRFRPTDGDGIPPSATHLYLGGGFPEEYLQELTEYPDMFRDVYHRIVADGIPTLAECGGYMFLGEAIWSKGRRFPMVGAIPMETELTSSLKALGYRDINVRQSGVFPAGSRFRGHEYHHSRILRETGLVPGYEVSSSRKSPVPEGHSAHHLLAGYSHLYFPSCPEAIDAWLRAE